MQYQHFSVLEREKIQGKYLKVESKKEKHIENAGEDCFNHFDKKSPQKRAWGTY